VTALWLVVATSLLFVGWSEHRTRVWEAERRLRHRQAVLLLMAWPPQMARAESIRLRCTAERWECPRTWEVLL
jgi:hypothetical protein